MSELTLEIEGGRSAFVPGETIRGTAVWQLVEVVESLEVRLFWYTVGKGDRDVGGVETVRIDHPGTEGRHDFEFEAPAAPHAFSGKLISLIWAVELVELPDGDAAREEIVIAPTGEEIQLVTPEALDGSTPVEPS